MKKPKKITSVKKKPAPKKAGVKAASSKRRGY